MPIQDVLIVPLSATTIDEALATIYAVYPGRRRACASGNTGCGRSSPTRAGWPRRFANVEAMLDDAVDRDPGGGL